MTEEQKTIIPGIVKQGPGVLINKDNLGLAAYKRRKAKERRIEMMEEEVKSIKNDLEEIKLLLRGLAK